MPLLHCGLRLMPARAPRVPTQRLVDGVDGGPGKSGWWVLVNLIALLVLIRALIDDGMLRHAVGPNRFGASPNGRF